MLSLGRQARTLDGLRMKDTALNIRNLDPSTVRTFRIMAAELGLTYSGLLTYLLEELEERGIIHNATR